MTEALSHIRLISEIKAGEKHCADYLSFFISVCFPIESGRTHLSKENIKCICILTVYLKKDSHLLFLTIYVDNVLVNVFL